MSAGFIATLRAIEERRAYDWHPALVARCCRAEGATIHSLWGLLVLVADIGAIVSIAQSGADPARKVLWILLVIGERRREHLIWEKP